SLTKSLTLSHDQNSLSFEFAALSYASPERTVYRYRLDGLESEWNELDSTRRFVRYTTLAPGAYVFRVQRRARRSHWIEAGVQLNIMVLPPWGRTWWFGVFSALALAIMVWLAYWFHMRQVTQRLNLRFEERLAERARIARDLHDTLLQSFQGVILKFSAVK